MKPTRTLIREAATLLVHAQNHERHAEQTGTQPERARATANLEYMRLAMLQLACVRWDEDDIAANERREEARMHAQDMRREQVNDNNGEGGQ